MAAFLGFVFTSEDGGAIPLIAREEEVEKEAVKECCTKILCKKMLKQQQGVIFLWNQETE